MNDSKFRFGLIKKSNNEPIPEDEPIFIIRGRDTLAVPLLKAYRSMSEVSGCTDYHIKGISEVIGCFQKFAREHSDRMKQPGITKGL